VLELPSNEAVRSAVEAGIGVTAISRLAAESGLAAGRLRARDFGFPQRPFHVLRHRERFETKAVQALLALLPS
jgi:DNA-binding transcriptional LysR family regulator